MAGLVLFLEAAQKGIATALIIAASSMALFCFLLAGLHIYAREGPDRETRPNRATFASVSPLGAIKTRLIGARHGLRKSRNALLLGRKDGDRILDAKPTIEPKSTSTLD